MVSCMLHQELGLLWQYSILYCVAYPVIISQRSRLGITTVCKNCGYWLGRTRTSVLAVPEQSFPTVKWKRTYPVYQLNYKSMTATTPGDCCQCTSPQLWDSYFYIIHLLPAPVKSNPCITTLQLLYNYSYKKQKSSHLGARLLKLPSGTLLVPEYSLTLPPE